MAEPSHKAQPLEDLLERVYGRTSSIRSNVCVFCKKDATEFRDALSRREYSISGLCQDCQDEVFGVDESEFIEVELDINVTID